MGLPYSRQINAAFDQVTPLVAAGFKVLRTTRDISVLLAVIQVLTVILLSFILIALVLLVYSVNPDLDVRCLLYYYSSLIESPLSGCLYMYIGREKNPHYTPSPIPCADHILVDIQIHLLSRSCVRRCKRGDVAFFCGEAVGGGCRV